MNRALEFFADSDGRMSMTRLLCFLAYPPASYALFLIKTEDALLYYLGAFVVGYIGGKGADAWRCRPPGPSGITKTGDVNVSAN